jgi:hypothetical protein
VSSQVQVGKISMRHKIDSIIPIANFFSNLYPLQTNFLGFFFLSLSLSTFLSLSFYIIFVKKVKGQSCYLGEGGHNKVADIIIKIFFFFFFQQSQNFSFAFFSSIIRLGVDRKKSLFNAID